MFKLSIVVPVYNEAKTVTKILDQVFSVKLKNITKEIIVVDDCSSDGTRDILDQYQLNHNIIFLKHTQNSGKGAAVKTGLKVASGDIILIQDADLEYDPNDYPDLLKPIISGGGQFVLGSRHSPNCGWKTRKFLDSKIYAHLLNIGGLLYGKLVNFLYNVRLTDPGTMYKVFRKECLEEIDLKSDRFDIDWELVAKMIKKGFIPLEIPVSYKSRSPKEGKKMRFFQDGTLILWSIIKYRFFD